MFSSLTFSDLLRLWLDLFILSVGIGVLVLTFLLTLVGWAHQTFKGLLGG